MEEFSKGLACHPDQQQVSYVLRGLQHGFRLGFHSAHKLKPAKRNKPSALHHAHIVDAYLANEVSLGRVAGPFSSSPFPRLHISSFGVIPKKGQPGKWHLIVYLSSPGGASVNNGIYPQDFSLQYSNVDQVIRMVSHYGPGALMAKFDVESAYRNIPVHQCMRWRGHFYVDLSLPFGLRSAPFIFNSVADIAEWILLHKHRLSDSLHYLDNSIIAGPPQSSQCAYNLNMAVSVCHRLGLPLHANKCVGPATSMTILGTELEPSGPSS